MSYSPAAGIIPYVKIPSGNNKPLIYFLLGYERGSWSGFVGGYEDSDGNILNTAVREFNEETAGIFESNLLSIKNKLVKSPCIISNTRNRKVYIWFLEMNPNLISQNLELQFLTNKKKYNDEHYKEKSMIKWFNIQQLHKNKILSSLKKEILLNYLIL